MSAANTTTGIDLDAAQLDKLQAEWETAFDMGKAEYPIDPATVLQLIELARRSTSGSVPTSIERFSIYEDHGHADMMGDDEGEYVLYSDHIAALKASGSDGTAAAGLSREEIYTLRRVIECAETLNERPRPMCRDCADENGTCPNSGLECDMRKLFADAKALHDRLAVQGATSGSEQTPASQPAATVVAADILRDMLAIQGACGLHTDEYAPGSVIEYIKELESDGATPPAPTRQPLADEREMFEQDANNARFFPREIDFARTTSPSGRDEYVNGHLQSRWEGWSARAALSKLDWQQGYADALDLAQPIASPAIEQQGGGAVEYIGKLRATLHAIANTLDDNELRAAAKEAYAAPTPAAEAELLSWLDGKDFVSLNQYIPSGGALYLQVDCDDGKTYRSTTAREAIRAAMSASQANGAAS